MGNIMDDGDEQTTSLDRLNANIAKMEELTQRLMAALSRRRMHDPGLQGPGHDIYMKAATAYVAEMMKNPAKMLEHQVSFWGKSLQHWVEAQRAFSTGETPPQDGTLPQDRRFRNALWDTHPYFHFVKEQYLLSSQTIRDAVQNLEGLSDADKRRVEFFTRQIVDMMSPANYLGTNPEALQKAVETEGQSLVDGLENMIRDIERNDGELLVTLSEPSAFKVGENLATTEGAVVYRNRMMELIQYAPKTDKVHRTPLVIFPPWINKFYILDLKPENSLIRWIVEQGFTLFVVSWVNPDASYADVGLDTYIEEGYLAAIREAKAISGESQVNLVGYCIGGTILAATLAYLQLTGDKSVRSATFFTTLTDFKDTGEMSVFLDDDFVNGIEREVSERGYLSSFFMSRTFSYLRAPDLVYGPAIRSYMMGEPPPAFDLLYWNGDSTNLPARMAIEYLRRLCQDDALARGDFEVLGRKVSLKDIRLPVTSVACETDHIAEWKAAFNGFRQFGSRDKTFILSQSGHIAGIVNPPSKNKYGHYTSDARLDAPLPWREGATFTEGSWWPRWRDWLARRSGAQVAARSPGDGGHAVLCPAPGFYVTAKPNE